MPLLEVLAALAASLGAGLVLVVAGEALSVLIIDSCRALARVWRSLKAHRGSK